MLLLAQSFNSSINASDYDTRCITPVAYANIQSNGAFGANYLHIGGYNPFNWYQAFKPIPAGISGFWGARYRSKDGEFHFGVQDPTSQIHLSFCIRQDGTLLIYRLNNHWADSIITTIFTSAIGFIPTTGWCFIEFGWVISPTAGSVSFRLNNQIVFTVSNIPTQSGTSTDPTSVAYYYYGYGDLQDMYVSDSTGPAPGNSFLGDLRVLEVPPTGAGSSTSFTPTGAPTNWQVAAQTSPTPATIFNSSNVVGALDLYTVATMPAGLGIIFGVQVTGLLNKTDPGLRIAGLAIKSGATLAIGSGHSVQVSPTIYSDVFSVDPATGVAFTPSGVSALQIGPTIIS